MCKAFKSRLFSCLTVHSRPPFPFTFCFLPPVNFGGAVGAVFPRLDLGRTHRRRPHSVSSPCPGKSPLPASRRAARPPTETIYSRPRKKLSADRCRCHHCQGQYSCRPYSYSTPTVLWRWHALRTSGHCELKPPLDTCSRSRLLACFPRCVFLFRRSFCFQGTVHR